MQSDASWILLGIADSNNFVVGSIYEQYQTFFEMHYQLQKQLYKYKCLSVCPSVYLSIKINFKHFDKNLSQ